MKGASVEFPARRVLAFIKELGMETVPLVLKSDQKPAIISVIKNIVDKRKAQTFPEHSPVEASQSNGVVERAIQSVQGQMRTLRLATSEKLHNAEIGPTHVLIPWLCRHSSWILDKFQPRWSGQTAYKSMRGKDYIGELIKFGECCMLHIADISKDKLKPRWQKGCYVGRLDKTNEALLITPSGVVKARSVKRLPLSEAWDNTFVSSCKGSPWNPTGKEEDPGIKRGNTLAPGNRLRKLYITEAILTKHGRTDDCTACHGLSKIHSDKCRERIEQAMVGAGEAFESRPQ